MAAIIRIKRRLEEEPVDTVVINCKKRKTEVNEDENEIATIFKFTTTVEHQEENILNHIKKPTKYESREGYKTHNVDLLHKLRLENHLATKNNRYKVINCRRTIGTIPEAHGSNDADLTIVDIEVEESIKNCEEKSCYVYDLYHTCSDDFAEFNLNELISIYPLSDELVYGTARDNGNKHEEDSDDDSDSNDENNWRNEYPDESDVESITEEDMLDAMNKVDLNCQNELSSDDGEEGFVYSIDSEGCGFEEDVDPTDVNRFGEMYARFKSRVNKTEPDDSDVADYCSESSVDNSDSYYY